MAGAFDSSDPATQTMLLDLFTEIAILEHLVRQRFNPIASELDAQQFGVLNYMVRQRRMSEKVDTLAWCFQVDVPPMMASCDALAARRYAEIDWVDGERHIFLTDAGRARHKAFLDEAATDVVEIVSDFDPEALKVTTETLKELRRTFDNLPDR
jgi:hypothetical protein